MQQKWENCIYICIFTNPDTFRQGNSSVWLNHYKQQTGSVQWCTPSTNVQLGLNKMSESRNRPGPVVDAVKTTHNIFMLFCFIFLCKGITIITSLTTHTHMQTDVLECDFDIALCCHCYQCESWKLLKVEKLAWWDKAVITVSNVCCHIVLGQFSHFITFIFILQAYNKPFYRCRVGICFIQG